VQLLWQLCPLCPQRENLPVPAESVGRAFAPFWPPAAKAVLSFFIAPPRNHFFGFCVADLTTIFQIV